MAHDEEEGREHAQRREQRRQTDGEFAFAEREAEESAELEDERRLAVKALVDTLVDEVRHEEVPRARHVRRQRRVARLGLVKDRRDGHDGQPHGQQRTEDADNSFCFHAP